MSLIGLTIVAYKKITDDQAAGRQNMQKYVIAIEVNYDLY